MERQWRCPGPASRAWAAGRARAARRRTLGGMDVVIAGGHGKIALRLERLLSRAGHRARALIRNPDHAADIEAAGGEPVVCDLEATDDLAGVVKGADAVVFAAGAGPGSGAARKRTVDYGGGGQHLHPRPAPRGGPD